MFDKFKLMGMLAAFMKDKEKFKAAGVRIKEQSEQVRAVGEGGHGAVKVTVTGQMKVIAVELQPALMAGVTGAAADEKTRGLAGELIAEAVNEANKAAQAQMKAIIEKEAKELGLPDLPGELTGLLS
jgi:DNA-binding protein YbaB